MLFIGELLKQAERFLADGLHPRILAEGFELAKDETLRILDTLKVANKDILKDRELLCSVARTSLRTKLDQKVCVRPIYASTSAMCHLSWLFMSLSFVLSQLADQLTEIVTDAVLTIAQPGRPIDLHMIEIMHVRVPTTPSLFCVTVSFGWMPSESSTEFLLCFCSR